MIIFKNRQDAAIKLSEQLIKYSNLPETLILALPRGGVVLGAVLADRLNLPLEVAVAKKINPPSSSEFAIGAIAEGGGIFIDPEYKSQFRKGYLEQEIRAKEEKVKEYLREFRADQRELPLSGKTVILADDGIATGYTMLAAVESVRLKNPAKIVVAIPIIPFDRVNLLRRIADELIFVDNPKDFMAIGQFYEYFPQVSSEEVKEILAKRAIKVKN